MVDTMNSKHRLKKQSSSGAKKELKDLASVHRQLESSRSQKEDEFQNLKESNQRKVESAFGLMKDQEAKSSQNEQTINSKLSEQRTVGEKVGKLKYLSVLSDSC